MRNLFLFFMIAGAPTLTAQIRIISHVTRDNGDFMSTVYLENLDVAPQNYSLVPYDVDGNSMQATTGTLGNLETARFSIATLFPGISGVSHFTVEGTDVRATIAYTAVEGEGSPAQVGETDTQAARYRVFAGNWARVFDGIAVVNTGVETTDVWVTQRDFNGGQIASKKAMTLEPMAKGVYVIGGPDYDHFETIADSYFEVHGDNPLAITALRGSSPGSELLWASGAMIHTPAAVKVINDNPDASAWVDPYSLGPHSADVNNMPQGEVWIDVANDGRLVGCAKDYRYGPIDSTIYNKRVWSGLYLSNDGGNSWDNRMFLDSDPNQKLQVVTRASFGQQAGTEITFDHLSDPVVMTDRDGNIYTCGLPYQERPATPGLAEPSAISLARRDRDGNLVAGTIHYLGLEDDPTLFNDKNWIAVSRDAGVEQTVVVVAWRLFTGGLASTMPLGGYVAVSGDGAATISEPIRLPLTTQQAIPTQFYQPLIARNPTTKRKSIYVFLRNYHDESMFTVMDIFKADIEGLEGTEALANHLSDPDNWLYLPTRIDGVFSYNSSGLGGGFRFSTFYMPTVDHETGYLYVASHAYNATTGGARVFVSRSTNGGRSWSDLKFIDYPGGYQFMPSIAVNNGTVSVLWYDSRHETNFTPNGIPQGLDVYYAELDTELEVQRILRLTPETQSAVHPVFTRPLSQSKTFSVTGPHDRSNIPGQGPFLFELADKDSRDCDGYGFIGDYIGLAADESFAYAIWADLRDLDTETDICSGNDLQGKRNQNVYFARIRKPQGASSKVSRPAPTQAPR